MKKFVFLYYGHWQPSPELMEQWGNWFAKIGPHLVDSGNPFGAGREITRDGSADLSSDPQPITGYSIVSAASLDEAEQLLQGLPIVDSVRIYEAVAM
jgi:hypothetical protein